MAPRARLQVDQMELPEWSDIQPLAKDLRGMVDLDKVVVVVGFGEVGPCGSSRTRWELESTGSLSIEGCLELAWIMGLVEYHQGPLPGTRIQNPATAASTLAGSRPRPRSQSPTKESRTNHDLSTPGRQQELQEIILERDLEPLAVSAETAAEMKVQHGDKVMVTESPEGQVLATLKAGAAILVPKAIPCVDRPAGALALVAASEAFLSAGITDPFDMYKELGCSVADVGNCLGTSVGRLRSAFHLYKGRYLQRNSQADILAETFPNTAAAWLNMLLLGAAGPIRTPVGACATSLESLDAAYDLVAGGKANFVIAGGADGIESDISLGFAHMSATVDATREAARGRSPREASRPMASTKPVLQKQLSHLGRSAGNPIACVCQKAVVGHGKACAAAFATNGSLQIMTSPDRIVPGNPNADNIDEKLQDRDLLFSGEQAWNRQDLVKAFTVTSFGFGQRELKSLV
ncbi:hypothetical protein MCOR01_011769 [Pyricularia oryzae]|nr:hypothetical protein MCOR01_011769 [Pyricularia oryzae]